METKEPSFPYCLSPDLCSWISADSNQRTKLINENPQGKRRLEMSPRDVLGPAKLPVLGHPACRTCLSGPSRCSTKDISYIRWTSELLSSKRRASTGMM